MCDNKDWLDYWGMLVEGLGEFGPWLVAFVLIAWIIALMWALGK